MKRPLPHQDPDDATSLVRPMLPSSSVRMGNNNKKAPALCRLRTIPLEEGLRRPSTNDTEPPYHVYSQRQKWTIVSLVSLAGCLSPLSSNAYFPAATAIASDLRVTECLIGLTITVYMIVQGIAPLPLGAVSDNKGRRLVIIASLAVFAVINLGLSFTSSYPMLLSLRGLQAAGSAAAVSISAGVIADIVSPNERGKFMGMHVGTKMTGQAVGPIIGGALDAEWGFRSIFWMLFAFSFLVLLTIVIFLPETHRDIAGDGSVPLSGFHKPPAYILWPPKEWEFDRKGPRRVVKPLTWRKFFAPVIHLLDRGIFVLVFWGALVFAIWSMVTSSTTAAMLIGFPHLNRWQLGLCFLPNGLGCVTGSLCAGLLLDRSFERLEVEFKEQHQLSRVDSKRHRTFPFERARVPMMPYFSAALVVSLAVYGPSFRSNELNLPHGADLAAPLALQFFLSFTSTAICDITSTLLVDYFPHGSAGASAANNMCRCLLGAIGEGLIQPLIDSVELVQAYLVLAGIVLFFSPMVWVLVRYGETWRLERERKITQLI